MLCIFSPEKFLNTAYFLEHLKTLNAYVWMLVRLDLRLLRFYILSLQEKVQFSYAYVFSEI